MTADQDNHGADDDASLRHTAVGRTIPTVQVESRHHARPSSGLVTTNCSCPLIPYRTRPSQPRFSPLLMTRVAQVSKDFRINLEAGPQGVLYWPCGLNFNLTTTKRNLPEFWIRSPYYGDSPPTESDVPITAKIMRGVPSTSTQPLSIRVRETGE